LRKGENDMNKNQKKLQVSGILLIGGSFIGILFWLGMLFYAFFLGGVPSPGSERAVPLPYISVIGLGFAGAAVGLVTGIISVRGAKAAAYRMIIISALLGMVGSVPLFLLDLAPVGVFFWVVGAAPPAVYLLLTRNALRRQWRCGD
jgi:hypothetical protein